MRCVKHCPWDLRRRICVHFEHSSSLGASGGEADQLQQWPLGITWVSFLLNAHSFTDCFRSSSAWSNDSVILASCHVDPCGIVIMGHLYFCIIISVISALDPKYFLSKCFLQPLQPLSSAEVLCGTDFHRSTMGKKGDCRAEDSGRNS